MTPKKKKVCGNRREPVLFGYQYYFKYLFFAVEKIQVGKDMKVSKY